MHTLAFVNQKGGCGKTTTAVHLGGALAQRGAKVLVVDLDPQAHATMALSCAIGGEPTLADVLLHGRPVRTSLRSAPGGVALLPSAPELAEFEEIADRVLHAERFLARTLAELTEFEFVLIDCPPRVDGVLTANALRAADTAVLVVETGAFALQGAVNAMQILDEVASDVDTEFDLRVVGTLYDRRVRLARELLVGTQARFGPILFDTVIHESVRLREAAAYGVPVQVLDPECRAVRDFDALAREVQDLPRRSIDPSRRARREEARTARKEYRGVTETWMG